MGHEISLREMLDSIREMVNGFGEIIPVSFHKVKAHTGVIGNERAHTLAKSTFEEPGRAKTVGGNKGTNRRAWVAFGEGASVSGYKGVDEGSTGKKQCKMHKQLANGTL